MVLVTSVALTLTPAAALAATPAPTPVPMVSADPTPGQPDTATEPSSDASVPATVQPPVIAVTGDGILESGRDLGVRVTVTAEEGTPLRLLVQREQDSSPVDATRTDVTVDASGEAEVVLDGSTLSAGQYRVVDELSTIRGDAFTVADAPEAPSEPAPEQHGEASEAPDETVDVPLDEYYPQLAKDLFDTDGDGIYRIGAPAAGGSATGVVPAGLDDYYAQAADFTAEKCDRLGLPTAAYERLVGTTLRCGYVISPIDDEHPSAGNVAVATMVADHTGDEKKGSILWNPGGPGGSGLTLAVAGALYEPELLEHYDLIGFDPRGTGSSMPYSQCSTDEMLDEDRAANSYGLPLSEAEEDLNARAERFADDCFANTAALFDLDGDGSADDADQRAQQERLIENLGTWDAVGDVDVIRSVAGDQKLSFVGFSYGTRLGYVFSQKFGGSVGRLVLDGAVDPGNVDSASIDAMRSINRAVGADDPDPAEEAAESNIAQGAGFQGTFEQFALDCSARGARGLTWGEAYPDLAEEEIGSTAFTCPLGDGVTDKAALTAANQEILRTLERGALPTGQPGDERLVSFADARTGVFQALYSETLWSSLAQGLAELKEGRTAGGLMILADQYNDRDSETGHYAPMLQAFTTIRCTDENSNGSLPDIEKVRSFAERYDEAAPFQAASISPGVYDYCDFWRFVGTLPDAEELTAVPNILVVSTSHDSATPYASGVKLARLIDGTLLSVSGASHTSYMSGDEEKACVDSTVNDFLIDGVVPDDGDFGPALAEQDTAVDDTGETVTFDTRCKVETFRSAEFALSADTAHAGERIGFLAAHLVDDVGFEIAVDGESLASGRTDNGGNAGGQFTLPSDIAPGRYAVEFRSGGSATLASSAGSSAGRFATARSAAAGEVIATAELTILADDVPKTDDGDDAPASQGPAGGAADDGDGSSLSASAAGSLARSGTDANVGLLLAVVLVLVGGTLLIRRRRTAEG
ncbi:MAG: alpha/beta fold hydrolase [Mycetocola reblochoni]|uniref:TAP domain protein n=1 Tax=Mycetocola reblochoni REB411 TaxID=1255698 RepID=A0A1R4K0Z9_9MICO|nr:alpha/beta fold hydrolase [Mycetocola reblochoni]SJN37956.1 TAP domain protein [Mycetocola reblochoni REB411]